MGQDEGPRQQAGAGADGDDGAKPLGISFCGGRWVTSGEGQPSSQLASGPPLQQVPEFGAGVPPNPFLERADTMDAFSKSAVLDRTPSTPSMSRLQGMASGDKERNPSVWRMSGIAGGEAHAAPWWRRPRFVPAAVYNPHSRPLQPPAALPAPHFSEGVAHSSPELYLANG